MTQPNINKPPFVQMGLAHVICVAVSAHNLICCVHSNGAAELQMWDFQDDQPCMLPLVTLGFAPAHISLFEEKVLVVGDAAVALFMLEQSLFSAVAAGDGDGVEKSDDEGITITEEFLCSGVFSGVNHIAWFSDGSAAALPCAQRVFIVDCRVESYSSSCEDSENRRCSTLDCRNFYGEPGAAFAAFSASRLFLLSVRNHLVTVRCNNSEGGVFCAVEPQLERDGHIIVRAHSVTCFVIGGGENGHLVVGLSDGSLMLLQQESLQVFLTLNVTDHLYRMSNKPLPTLGKGADVSVLSAAVGSRFIVVVRPDAVVCYDKRSIDFLQERTTFLSGEVPVLSACAGNGSWCLWSPQKRELFYYAAKEELSVECCACAADDLVHAQVPLPSRLLEPLRLPFKEQASAARAEKGADRNSKKKLIVEKPVTFGHPIKSSGYGGSVPWSVLKKKQQRDKQLRGEKGQNGVRRFPAIATPLHYKALRFSAHPLQPMAAANKALFSSPPHSAMVTEAVFSANGTALLTASADYKAHWLKFPVEKCKASGTLMVAHTGSVNTVDVSLSVSLPIVATGSSDGAVAMWQPQKRETAYIVHKVCKEVRGVRFFYTDKFLCYAAGNSVVFCRYALDNNSTDELHRMRNESRMESVLEFSAHTAQSVAAFDCINYFTSNIVLWAGSNKSVGIYDVAAAESVQIIEEAHARPIHRVAMMTASRYASPSSNALHMYLTAGLDNAVRLWDIRQRRAVRHLSLHRNSATSVGVAFSPNGTAVAVGSETRAVFLYDVGTGAVIDNVALNDTPTALCWHPLEGILAVGTAAGALQLLQQR